MLKKLWVWAKEEKLNPSELKKKFLLAKDHHGYTAWDRAAIECSLEALETLWCCAKEAELNSDILLVAQNEKGNTAWKMATQEIHLEVMKTLWVWAKNASLDPHELTKKLLLAKDKYGYTAWDRAAIEGNLEALELLWNWAEEKQINKTNLSLAKNVKRKTTWQIAAQELHIEMMKKV